MRHSSLILLALLSAAPAAAEGPSGPPGPSAGLRGGPHGRPPGPGAAGSAMPMPSGLRERMEQRREQMSEHMRDRMERMQDRMRDARGRHEHARALSGQIAEQLRNGNPHPEELKKQLEEFKSLRDDRRADQRAVLRQRWGHALQKPDVKDELERHARRLARLQRLEVVVATERTGDQRKRLIERIERMRTLENKRHLEAMQKLAPGASASPDTSAAAAAPPSPSAAPAAAPAPAASGGSL